MPHSLSSASLHKDTDRHKQNAPYKHTTQHGYVKRSSPDPSNAFRLLELPAESLTHVTSFLDPSSLLALGRTNKRLHEHIEDENTWRRAYVNQFLGISPEGDIYESSSPTGYPGRALMLRREESTWKREFVRRWNLKRRWENIRPATISHTPVHSAIAEMHLMPSASPDPALLTASLRYGIVARSLPLKGKTLRGYLDASGTLNGIGHGNPNAEFSPDVSRCVMSADGGTARVLWGFRTGAIAVTTAPKAVDAARAVGARWLRCPVGDAHEGAVEDAAWGVEIGSAPRFFVTGGADGRVKIWDAKRVSSVWTSKLKPGQVLKDPVVKVAIDIAAGVVAAALKSGECVLWSGFSAFFEEAKPIDDGAIAEVHIPAPRSSLAHGPYTDSSAAAMAITSFHLFCESPSQISLLASYKGEPRLTRSTVTLPAGTVEQVAYGDDAMVAITAVCPVFATKPGEHSFVLVGDQLGQVSVFPWNSIPTLPSPQGIRSVPSARRFQAHSSSAITALVWTPTVIVTGSSVGNLRAFDSLTLQSTRSFTYPLARNSVEEEVKDIVVERDFFAASIGDRVVAWRGEPQGKTHKPLKGKGASRSSNAIAKWHQQAEISREIKESKRELEYEHEHVQKVYGRAREQHSTLEHLGLTEVEAVEYVLMLSRDEEEQRRLAQLRDDFEVFGGDFDEDVHTPVTTPASFLHTPSTSTTNRYGFADRVQFAPSSSMAKVQVSPRVRPEPMEAGFSCSPLSRSASGSLSSSVSSHGLSRTNSQAPTRDDPRQFPSISSTPTRRSVSGSPASYRSAWSTPLQAARSEGPSSPRGGGSVASSPGVSRAPGVSLLSEKFAAAMAVREEDEDLRFALELSLAEARSRGEAV